MNKFKLATKKIATVGTAVAVASSSVLAAGLYPSMFVEDGMFNGQVVVGAAAAASDTVAAEALIADLALEFSGEVNQVEIVARKAASGGDSVSAVDTKETLNFGETLGAVDEELDSDVSDLLEDGALDNNDFTQELELVNGEFSYRIFDEVDGEDTAKAGLYYDANQDFAIYTLDFEDEPSIAGTDDEDLVGQEMSIMGNEFTVVEIAEDSLTLIGGSNKIALGEAESTTVTVDGKSYTIEVQSVSDEEVLLTVNGVSKSVDEFEVEEVAGISVAVTDLVDSSRDSVKGYAEIVVGGQKVELEDGKTVKINDEDLDDIDQYDAYDVEVAFVENTVGVFEGFTITYKVDDNVVLGSGDSLMDVLFDSFALTYDGINDVDYTDLTITTSKDGVTFNGELFDGEELPSEFQLTTDDEAAANIYLGTDSERIYFQGSDLSITDLETSNSMDAISFDADNVTVQFDINASTTDVKGNMFFTLSDDDEFYLYEISGLDKDDLEIDFTDLLSDKETNAVDIDDVDSSLEFPGAVASDAAGNLSIDTSALGNPILYLANELEMDFSAVEEAAFTNGGTTSNLTFDYNTDIEMDDAAFESDSFILTIERATDEDDALEISIGTNDFISTDDLNEDSDFEVSVDHYGTMLTIDTEDKDDVTISVPDKEVEALVTVSFGSAAGSETSTYTVDASEVEAKKEELIDDGYSIVSENAISSEAVEFDVESVTLDSAASGSDMIVIGGPAVNSAARDLLGITSYDVSQAGVNSGEGIARVFEDENSVLIYGYSAADTVAIVEKVNAGTANFQ